MNAHQRKQDRFRLTMHQKVIRYRIEKFTWVAITLGVLALYELDDKLWTKLSILYLALVSNYALVLTAGGAEQAASAALEASDES